MPFVWLCCLASQHNRTRLGPLNSALFPTSAAAVPDPMSSSVTVTARGSLVAQPLNMADAQLRADSRLQTAQKERLLKVMHFINTPSDSFYTSCSFVEHIARDLAPPTLGVISLKQTLSGMLNRKAPVRQQAQATVAVEW